MRRSPLRRAASLDRRTPMRRVNRARRARRFREAYGERGAAVREFWCVARCTCRHGTPGCQATTYNAIGCDRSCSRPAPCRGRVEAAHVRSRARGGTRRDLVPLCTGHHAEQHAVGLAEFERRYGLDLAELAARLATELDGRGLR